MNRRKLLTIISIIIWVTLSVSIIFTVYVNYYLPHGSSYATGDFICENDERGPCHEKYIEDMSALNIPIWAKFFRKNGFLLFFALSFLGMLVNEKLKTEDKYGVEKPL